MSSLRMRALEYISKNGNHMPYQEVADGLNEPPQRVRGALSDASKDGLLSFGRDDITGQGGYSLTAKGKARIVNGHQTINGKQASENKKASDEKEAHVMSAPPANDLREVVDRLLAENASLRKEAADVRDDLEESQRELMKGATLANSALMKQPIGYAHVWADGFARFDTEDDARRSIEESFASMIGDSGESLLCAVIDTAMVSVKWSRS